VFVALHYLRGNVPKLMSDFAALLEKMLVVKAVLVVAAGGAVGRVARYPVYVAAGRMFGTSFPFGTIIVNVVGSLIIGLLTELMARLWSPSTEMRLSDRWYSRWHILEFFLDVAVLYTRGEWMLCAIYLWASLVLSIGDFFFGLGLVRHMVTPAVTAPPSSEAPGDTATATWTSKKRSLLQTVDL
jgi:CrcB protein